MDCLSVFRIISYIYNTLKLVVNHKFSQALTNAQYGFLPPLPSYHILDVLKIRLILFIP